MKVKVKSFSISISDAHVAKFKTREAFLKSMQEELTGVPAGAWPDVADALGKAFDIVKPTAQPDTVKPATQSASKNKE